MAILTEDPQTYLKNIFFFYKTMWEVVLELKSLDNNYYCYTTEISDTGILEIRG